MSDKTKFSFDINIYTHRTEENDYVFIVDTKRHLSFSRTLINIEGEPLVSNILKTIPIECLDPILKQCGFFLNDNPVEIIPITKTDVINIRENSYLLKIPNL